MCLNGVTAGARKMDIIHDVQIWNLAKGGLYIAVATYDVAAENVFSGHKNCGKITPFLH